MKLVILITVQIEGGLEVAQRWRENGAPGVTILRSYGIHSLLQEVERGEVELPRMVMSMAGAMAAVMESAEQNTEILLSGVPDELVDGLITIAGKVLGDLTAPNTGVLFVLPVERAIGVFDHRTQA